MEFLYTRKEWQGFYIYVYRDTHEKAESQPTKQ